MRFGISLIHTLHPPNDGLQYWARRIPSYQALEVAESEVLSFKDLPGRPLEAGVTVEFRNGDFLIQHERFIDGVILYSLSRVSSGELELQYERRVRGVPLYSPAPLDLVPLLEVLEEMGDIHRAIQLRTGLRNPSHVGLDKLDF